MVLLKFHPDYPTETSIGIDESSRGCLAGRVYAAAVLWNNDVEDEKLELIKDSKKLSKKKRALMKEFIEENALAFGVGYVENDEIDRINIYHAAFKAMHNAIDNLIENMKKKGKMYKVDRLLVDGNKFTPYINKETGFIVHTCVPKGDSLYLPIAAASILAKTYHTEYIEKLCDDNPELNNYGFKTNSSYGTKKHYEALAKYGATKFHRLSFNLHIN